MPSELLSGPLATLWKTMNDNDTLRSVADRMVQVGNMIHEHLAEGGGGDTKTPAVVDKTIEFVDDADQFFAFVNLMDAHLPYHPPEAYAEEFAPASIAPRCARTQRSTTPVPATSTTRSGRRSTACTTPRSATWTTSSTACSPT